MSTVQAFYKRKEGRPTEPSIWISEENFAKIKEFIQNNHDTKTTTKELMLLGTVIRNEKNENLIDEILVPPQTENSSAYVTTDDERYGAWLTALPREQRNRLRMHLHSHPGTGYSSTTPSGTDQSTLYEKLEELDDFYIRIIVSSDVSALHIDYFDIAKHTSYGEMPLNILCNAPNLQIMILKDTLTYSYDFENTLNKEQKEQIKEELKEKVKKRVYYTGYPTNQTQRTTFPQDFHYGGYDLRETDEKDIDNPFPRKTENVEKKDIKNISMYWSVFSDYLGATYPTYLEKDKFIEGLKRYLEESRTDLKIDIAELEEIMKIQPNIETATEIELKTKLKNTPAEQWTYEDFIISDEPFLIDLLLGTLLFASKDITDPSELDLKTNFIELIKERSKNKSYNTGFAPEGKILYAPRRRKWDKVEKKYVPE